MLESNCGSLSTEGTDTWGKIEDRCWLRRHRESGSVQGQAGPSWQDGAAIVHGLLPQ